MEWIKKQLSDHWLELIMLGLTSWAIIWAFLESLGPWIIVIAFALVGIGLLIINQLHTIRERRKRGFASLSDQEIERTVRDWLDVPYFSVERKVNNESLFQFNVMTPSGIPVSVQRPRSERHLINLALTIIWSEEDKAKLRSLPKSTQQHLMGDLKIEMLRFGIYFSSTGEAFDHIFVREQIVLDDSLSGFYFRQRIFFVVRAIALVTEIVSASLIEPPSTGSTPDTEGSPTE